MARRAKVLRLPTAGPQDTAPLAAAIERGEIDLDSIIAPSLIGVALFGFTLSYDEFARSLITAGSLNTLPLEIYGMTTNVTTPVLYALGTLTTGFSFLVILVALGAFALLQRRRAQAGSDAGKGV